MTFARECKAGPRNAHMYLDEDESELGAVGCRNLSQNYHRQVHDM